jgi:arsenite methyltransferase
MKPVVEQVYTRAAKETVRGLCCPPAYDPKYLEIIPGDVIEKDYGCGDPTPYVRAGDTVLDLGSGTGKMAFIMAQIVGSEGRVIGLDANATMIDVSRNAGPIVSLRIGWRNVEFKRAAIEDLDLDLDLVDRHLKTNRIATVEDSLKFERFKQTLRLEHPPIADGSIDAALSNCVLNLIDAAERPRVFATIFRKLKPGGRMVISDIVCNSTLPSEIANDPELDAQCISGAFSVAELTELFARTGFVGTRIEAAAETWQTIGGADFCSMTFVGFKPAAITGDLGDAVVTYRGPWKSVEDDRGNVFVRGEAQTIGGEAAAVLLSGPYANDLLKGLSPTGVPSGRGAAVSACCNGPSAANAAAAACCSPADQGEQQSATAGCCQQV